MAQQTVDPSDPLVAAIQDEASEHRVHTVSGHCSCGVSLASGRYIHQTASLHAAQAIADRLRREGLAS